MSSTDTFIATLLGGFLAGITGLLTGLFTSRYDRRLRRREAHRLEHKRNFETIQEALVSMKVEVWPLTAKGAENLMLPRWTKPASAARLKNYSIADFQLIETIGDGGLGPPNLKITTVDKVLYSDMGAHFADLSAQLAGIERSTRTDGVKIDTLQFLVSKAIYSAMASSDLSVLRYTFDQGKRATLRDIPLDGIEGQGYAGWLFLMLIGEDPGNWPNDYDSLKRYGLLGGLERLAGEIKASVGPEVREMLKLRNELFSKIDSCIEVIERQRHRMTMKHGCEYL